MSPDSLSRAVVRVDGRVQGVGFRWWASRLAGRLGLVGSAVNQWDGSVTVDVQGLVGDVDAMVAALTSPREPGRPGHVSSWHVDHPPVDATVTDFETR